MFSSTFPYNYFPSFLEPTRANDYQMYAHTMYVCTLYLLLVSFRTFIMYQSQIKEKVSCLK